MVNHLSITQLQKVAPSSTKTYQNWIKSQAVKQGAPRKINTEVLEKGHGAKIHWVGNESAVKVIFYLHSGGFVAPLNDGHMNLANLFRRHIITKSEGRVDVKIAFLEYTLTPQATYPTQFQQAIHALHHILSTHNISPRNLLICGDSAGGMLSMQILSHLLHPYPSLPVISIPPDSPPFAGILAMSPWLVFESESPSYYDDKGLDLLTSRLLKYWADCFRKGTCIENNQLELLKKDGSAPGYWSEPGKAPAEWWHNSSNVVSQILLTSGAYEIMNDDIQRFGDILKKASAIINKEGDGKEGGHDSDKFITVMTEPAGMHIGPTVDSTFLRPPTEFTNMITGWVHERLAVADA